MKKKLLTLPLIIILSGCLSTPEKGENNNQASISKNIPKQQGHLLGKHNPKKHNPNIYAKLEKQDGKYTFTEFSLQKNTDKESPWVNLTTQEPLFFTGEETCQTGTILSDADESWKCQTGNESPIFRTSTVGVGNIVTNTVGNAFVIGVTFGLGAVVARGYYTSKFDEDAYEDAFNEANQKIDQKKFFEELEQFQKRRTEVSQTIDNELENIKAEIRNAAEKLHASVKKNLSVKTVNKSGLSQAPKVNESYIKTFEIYDLSKLPMLKNETPVSWSNVSELNNYFSVKVDNYRRSLAEQRKIQLDKTVVSLHCQEIPDWNHRIDKCDTKWSIFEPVGKHTVNYSIISKPSVTLRVNEIYIDKNIKVNIENDSINITNLTSSYLKLESFSFYVNKDISTKTIDYELPPVSSKIILNLQDFNNTSELNVFNVTKKVLKQKVNLGIAVKYTVVDRNKQHSLYKVKPYRVSQLTILN